MAENERGYLLRTKTNNSCASEPDIMKYNQRESQKHFDTFRYYFTWYSSHPNCTWHSSVVFISFVLNNVIKNLLAAKSMKFICLVGLLPTHVQIYCICKYRPNI